MTLCPQGLKTPTTNSYNYIASKANVNGSMLAASERRGDASTHCAVFPDVTHVNNKQRCKNFWLPQCLCLHVRLTQRTSENPAVQESQSCRTGKRTYGLIKSNDFPQKLVSKGILPSYNDHREKHGNARQTSLFPKNKGTHM